MRINYYPPRGDNKEGWDNIDIFGWLGYPMQIKVNFLCRDSILAAPVALDLALYMDLASRAGMRGAWACDAPVDPWAAARPAGAPVSREVIFSNRVLRRASGVPCGAANDRCSSTGRSAAREAAAARCRCAISSFTIVARAGCACSAVAPMLDVVMVPPATKGRAMAGDWATRLPLRAIRRVAGGLLGLAAIVVALSARGVIG